MAGLLKGIISLFTGGESAVQPPQVMQQSSAPSYVDPSIQAAALAQQTAQANARGRQSTIMTSGQGDESVVTTAKKQLLGS